MSDRDDAGESGWYPKAAGKCAECGDVYALRETNDGELVPVGTACCQDCGGTEFVTL